MNTNQTKSKESCDCSILSSYQSLKKESHESSGTSNLKAVKLQILKKLIDENKCPTGHDFECFCDRKLL